MIVKRMVMQIDDNGEEIEVEEEHDDGLPDPSLENEDRGDNLDDGELEVDEEIIAQLAGESKDDRVIPKSRFDEVNNEKNALKDQLAALTAQIAAGAVSTTATPAAPVVPAAPSFDLDAKEEAWMEAITEGDLDKAKGLRKEIRDFEKQATLAEFRSESEQTTLVKTVEARKAAVVSQAFTDHPELDNQSATYNPELVGKINRMQAAYLSEGKPADEALSLAIADFIVKSSAPAPKIDVPARAKAAAAAAAQPPGLGGAGTGARAATDALVDLESMPDSEYDALPEREKKRLRGD